MASPRLPGRYLAVARRRAGSPQFIHPHAMLRKGWELANAMLPGLDKAAAAAGAVTVNAMSDMKEVRCFRTVQIPLTVVVEPVRASLGVTRAKLLKNLVYDKRHYTFCLPSKQPDSRNAVTWPSNSPSVFGHGLQARVASCFLVNLLDLKH